MTKYVVATRCMDAEQYERIANLLKRNVELTKEISAEVVGHSAVVHEADVMESALVLENKQLELTLELVKSRAG